MYKVFLLLASSLAVLALPACSDPPANYTIECSRGAQSADGIPTINCGDGNGDGNVIGSPGSAVTAPVVERDAGSIDSAKVCPPLVASPWFRADGSEAFWPNFVAPSDGLEWIYPLPVGVSVDFNVIVSQHGPDAPLTSANLAVVVYDNTGIARPTTEVDDVPSTEKHVLTVRPPASGPGDTVKLILQAPSAAAGADAGLWVWGAPTCD